MYSVSLSDNIFEDDFYESSTGTEFSLSYDLKLNGGITLMIERSLVVAQVWNSSKKKTITFIPLHSFFQECVFTMMWKDGKISNF